MASNRGNSRLWMVFGWLCVLAGLAVGFWWYWHLPTTGKGGLVLAVGATLMPLFWEKVGVVGKMAWIAMLFLLLAVEYRAIDKDHEDSAKAQREELNSIGEGFKGVLTEQQNNFSTLAKSSQENFRQLIESEQRHFERMMTNSLNAQKQEREAFARVIQQENDMLARQSNTLGFLTGKLIPATDQTPGKPCIGENDTDTVVILGNNRIVAHKFPRTILQVCMDAVITADKAKDGTLLIGLNLRTEDDRVSIHLDDSGLWANPRYGLVVRKPDLSTLVVVNERWEELLNIRYLNPNAIRINPTVLPIRGRTYRLPNISGCSNTDYPEAQLITDIMFSCF